MDPVDYVGGLRRRWPVIVASVVVGTLAALLASLGAPGRSESPSGQFEASVLMLDARSTQGSTTSVTDGFPFDALAILATTEEVVEQAAERLPGDNDVDELRARVDSNADANTKILTITATAERASEAEKIAAAFADALRSYLKGVRNQTISADIGQLRAALDEIPAGRGGDAQRASLQGQIGQLETQKSAPLGLIVIDETSGEEVGGAAIRAPSSRGVRLALGALIGLIGGVILALVLERFDRKLRSRTAFEANIPSPLLAEVPQSRSARKVAVFSAPTSPAADAFRILGLTAVRSMTDRVDAEGNGHGATLAGAVVAVTSAGRGEGKSLVAANLAGALGELGMKVIVISCDLRRPSVHQLFDARPAPGVTDALHGWDGRPGFRRVRQETKVANVTVVASGAPSAHPARALGSDAMASLVGIAKEEADVVILDTPALLLCSDAVTLVQGADAVILVARTGKSTAESVERVSEALSRLGANTIGFVLNGTKAASGGYGGAKGAGKRATAETTIGVAPSDRTPARPGSRS